VKERSRALAAVQHLSACPIRRALRSVVVSSDLSHYHDYDTARRLDAGTAAAIERADWARLGPNSACGFLAVAGLLVEANRRGLRARRLLMCNSGDTVGSRDRVVGYGTWTFVEVPRR